MVRAEPFSFRTRGGSLLSQRVNALVWLGVVLFEPNETADDEGWA
jgi:hypothetical protein